MNGKNGSPRFRKISGNCLKHWKLERVESLRLGKDKAGSACSPLWNMQTIKFSNIQNFICGIL
jgi:hypothetical protein